MHNKIFSIFILLFFNLQVLAALTPEETKWVKENLPKYEDEFNSKLKSTEKRKQYYLLVLAGNALYEHELYAQAEKYFLKALEAPDTGKVENKASIYHSLLTISYKQNNQAKMKKYLELSKNYYQQNPKFLNDDVKNVLNFHEFSMTAKQNEIMPLPFGPESGFHLKAREHNFYALFKKGDYAKALTLIEPAKVRQAGTIDTLVELDLLNVLVNGKDKVSELGCSPIFEKYSKSFDYGVMTCDILRGYLKDGKVAPEKMAKLETYFKEFDKDKSFFVKALKKL